MGNESVQPPCVVLAGQFQQGKSTFVNCMLRGRYALEGQLTQTTSCVVQYVETSNELCVWKIDMRGRRISLGCDLSKTIQTNPGCRRFVVEVPSESLRNVSLVDAPGWGAGREDNAVALESLNGASLVVYVVSKELDKADIEFLCKVKDRRVRYVVLLNCRNKDNPSPDDDSQAQLCANIYGALRQNSLTSFLIRYPAEHCIAAINLKWAKYGVGLLDDPQSELEKTQLDEILNRRLELKDLRGDKDGSLRESRMSEFSRFMMQVVRIIHRISQRGKNGHYRM